MINKTILISTLVFTLTTACHAVSVNNNKTKDNTKTQSIAQKKNVNSILVGFRENVSRAQATKLIKSKKAEIIRKYTRQNTYHISNPPGLSISQTIALFENAPGVKFAEPNGKSNRR